MNKIERLIERLCPSGVEWKPLGEVATIERGVRVTKKDLVAEGEFPVISGGINPLGRYNKFNREANTITIAQYGTAGYVNWQEECFWANDVCYCIFPQPGIDNRYLYQALMWRQELIYSLKTDAIPAHLPQAKLASISIPVPPLEIQSEIVQILDNFAKLTAELTAELAKRKKQYEHYRDTLLSGDWPRVKLGEVCEMKAGKAISASEISQEQNNSHLISCYGANGFRGYVSIANTIGEHCLIGRQGALCGNVCFAKGPFYATEHAVVVTPDDRFENRFLFHLLTKMNLNQYKSQGAQPGLSVARLEELTIPLPPLAEQERIVAILDKFDKLVNSLTEGLPAEIAGREKQYAYYRDRLLSFGRTAS